MPGQASGPDSPTCVALRTDRLLLRAWRDEDLEPFTQMNADARVMEHFPAPMTPEETAARMSRIQAHWARHGFGLWVVEVPRALSFAGFVGLAVPGFEAAFMPCVEIAWRLAFDCWHRGYASEGARAATAFGFEQLGLNEIVSTTVPANMRSQRVMQRLGMIRDATADFDHPRLPIDHRLRRHVLYRLPRAAWRSEPGQYRVETAGT